MNPLAVVYWTENEEDHNEKAYTQGELNMIIGYIRKKNLVSYTCLCDERAAVPYKPRKGAVEELSHHVPLLRSKNVKDAVNRL